ncbi:hypothetical protein [Pumilibacter muris]|uniref:hypothetical protein n=1 Tax=Pumilibacter muris TaxID=2941510 RepID=UPI00204266AE|nr:hypothetical protein [Pumilibacter muris]
MPISDKVIELETKKKGRNILFIVLIAVLAAASVAFAVLWVTKAPAIDPPSIEKISVGSGKTDLSQVNDPLDDEVTVPVYRVAPNVLYNIEFNVVLKNNNYTKDDVNSLIKVYSEPAAAITPVKTEYIGSGDDDVVAVVVFGFRVSETVKEDFKLIVTSEFSPEVREIIEMKVEEGYAEHFDVDDYADSDGNVTEGLKAIAPIRLVKEVNGSITSFKEIGKGDPLELALQQDKSTDTTLFYRVSKQIPYYEGIDLHENNLEHEFDFSQLGAVGTNGKRAKIMQGVMGNGGYYDQVRVLVADKWNPEDSDYKEITDAITQSGNLEFDLHPHKSDGAYCRKNIRFKALKKGQSTIRLIANEYNGAPIKREIIIEVEFLSSGEMDVVTDIVCFDPYTKMRTDEIDLYFEQPISTSSVFKLSDYVKVMRKGVLTTPVWGRNNLYPTITEGDKLVHIETTASSVSLRLLNKSVGDATLLIQDNELNGMHKSVQIYIHIRAPIDEVSVKATDMISTFSGDTPKTEINYTIAQALFNNDAAVSSLNSDLVISYSEGIDNKNEADTITVDGAIKNVLSPKLTKVNGSKNTLSAPLGFKIGKNVPDGIHTVTFTLASQALDKDTFEPAKNMFFEVKFKVVRTAASFRLNENYDFTQNSDDRHTQLTCSGNTATLTLAVGSGKTVTGETDKVTVFNLKDLILFFDENGEPVTNSQDDNYAFIKKTDNNGAYSKETDSFIVPETPQASRTVRLELDACVIVLNIEYKYAIGSVELATGSTSHSVYYANPELYEGGANVVTLGNANLDKPQLISTNGKIIASSAQIINKEYVSLDIAVKRGEYPYLLPKKIIGTSVYYYPLGTKEEDMTEQTIGNALFKTNGTSDILTDSSVIVLRDLFAVSVETNEDWQTFILYYSYGENPYTIKDGYISGFNSDFTKNSNYTLYRRFDGMKLYTDNSYSQELAENSTLSFSSGDTFTAYYSGVIRIEGRADFIVERDNSKRFACSSVIDDYSPKTSSVEKLSLGRYKLTCEPTATYSGTFYFKEDVPQDGKSVYVNVSVSNTQVGIGKIELFLDEQHTKPFDSATLYTNAGRNNSVEVYYKVSYAEKQTGDTAYEEFEYTAPQGFAVTGFNPAFLNVPFDEVTSGNGVSFDENGALIYEGKLEITRTTAKNGTHEGFAIVSANKGVSASCNLRVTTAVEGAFKASLNAGGSELELSSDAIAKNITVVYTPNGTNDYTVLFKFAQNGNEIDRANLEYSAQFGGSVEGIKGVFCSQTGEFENGTSSEIIGYRFTALGSRIDDLLLTITVRERLDGGEEHTYELKLVITVDVEVETLGLQIDDETYSGNGGKLEVVTTGESGEQQFALDAVINGGDENRQPKNAPEPAYSFENVSDENVFRVHNGVLYVKNDRTQVASATLVLSAGGKEVKVLISVSTSKVSIAFNDSDIERVRTDNSIINVKATVINVGTNAVVSDAVITYTVKDDKNNIVVLPNENPNSPDILVRGSFGTFIVTASYTSPDGKTVECEATITVRVPASEIEVLNNAGTRLASNVTIEFIKGQSGNDCVFTAKAKSAVAGVDPADTALTVTSSNPDCVGAVMENGTLTLNPLKAGDAVITISGADGKTFVFNVKVSQALLNVDFKNALSEIDVFASSSTDFEVALSGAPNGCVLSDVKIFIDGSEIVLGDSTAGAFSVALTGVNYYRISVNRAVLTASDIANHTVRVTAQLQRNGVSVLSLEASSNFDVTAESSAYSPKIELRKNGSLVQPVNGVYEIDKKNASEYKFVLANSPAVSFATTFAASNGLLTLNNSNNSATITVSGCGNASVGLNVVLFGDNAYTFTSSVEIVIADSGVLESKAYLSNDENGEVTVNSDGAVAGATEISGSVDISYVSSPKVLVLVVNFEGAPSALANADVTKFIVSDNSALELVKTEILHGKFFVARYKAKGEGEIKLGVHTVMLGGTVYSANTVSATLTATAPQFTASNASGITLNPGESATVTVSNASGFKGNVTYSATLRSEFATVTQNAASLNEFAVGALMLHGGGNATLIVTAQVSGGLFNGYKEVFEIPVTVNVYDAPIVSVTQEAVLDANEKTFEFGPLWSVKGGEGDDGFDYNVAYDLSGNIPGTFTFPSGAAAKNDGSATFAKNETAKNGAVFEIPYTFTVISGYYKGMAPVSGKIKVTVMPESATLTVDGGVRISGVRYVDANSRLTLSASVGAVAQEYISVSYSVDNGEWGYITGNAFVPTLYKGVSAPASSEVNVTANVKIVGGDYAGAKYTLTERVSVTYLIKQSASKFSAKPGERVDLSTLFANAFGNVARGITVSASDSSVVQDGNYLKLLPDSNYGSANKTVKLFVSHTDSSNRVYYGEFDFEILPIAAPVLDVTQNGNTFLANDGKTYNGASYKIEILSGKDLLDSYNSAYESYSANNAFTFTPKTNTVGGNVVLRVFMKIDGGDYANGVYDDKEFERTVTLPIPGKNAPSLSVGFTLSDDGNGGNITHTITNGDGYAFEYAYAVTEGGGILLGTDGSFTFIKTSAVQKAKVTVSVTVSGEPHDGLVLTAVTAEITVPAAVKPTISATVSGNVIVPEIDSADAASFSYVLSDEAQAAYIDLNSKTGEFKFKDSTFGGTIEITVNATMQSGAYKGTVISCKITVTAVAAPVPGELSLDSLTPDSVKNPTSFTGEFTFDGEGFEVLFTAVKEHSSRLSTHGVKGFVITPNAESTPVKITLYYRVTADCSYIGEVLSKEYDVPVPALPKLVTSVSGEKITVAFNYTPNDSGYTFAVADADKKFVTIDSDGNFVGSYESRTITVTVSATVAEGLFAGLEFTTETQITTSVPSLTLSVTRNENGGEIIPSLSEGGENALYEYTVVSGNSITLNSTSAGEFTVVSGKSGTTVVSVKATLVSGAVVENTATVVISADGAGITANTNSGDTVASSGKIIYEVTFDGLNNVTVTAINYDSTHITVVNNGGVITATADYDESGSEKTETVEFEIMYESESGEYVFATVTCEIAYKINETVVEPPVVTPEE